MNPPVRFPDGAEGEAEGYADGVISLVAPRAFAPGAPLGFELGTDAAATLSLTGRTIGSKRREDGRFTVRVRLTNLRRAEREELEARVPGRA